MLVVCVNISAIFRCYFSSSFVLSVSALVAADSAKSNLRGFWWGCVHGEDDPVSFRCLPRTQGKSSRYYVTLC